MGQTVWQKLRRAEIRMRSKIFLTGIPGRDNKIIFKSERNVNQKVK